MPGYRTSCTIHDFCTLASWRLRGFRSCKPATHVARARAFIAAARLASSRRQGRFEVRDPKCLPEPLELTDAEISASRAGPPSGDITPPPHALNGTPGSG